MIRNQDEAFLEIWHGNLELFSLTLMLKIVTTSHLTISKVNEEIEETKAEFLSKPDRNENEKIISTLEKNDELNRYNKEKQRSLII